MITHHSFAILLWRDLVIFLFFGASLGILLGLVLIFKPQLLGSTNRIANRWVSTRSLNRWLDRSIKIERWFYRHHRVTGMTIMLGALYILIYFGIQFDQAYAPQHLSRIFGGGMLEILMEAIVLGALIGGIFALLMGLLIWLRPSLLRGVEREANQWISLRRATKILDVSHNRVDTFVARHAARVGWVLLLASIYLCFILFRSLM